MQDRFLTDRCCRHFSERLGGGDPYVANAQSAPIFRQGLLGRDGRRGVCEPFPVPLRDRAIP